MAKTMTGDFQVCLAGVIFHPLLNATNGYRLSGKRSLLYQKDLFYFVFGSHPEIVQKRMKGVVADIDNPVLCAFAILDEQHSALKINVSKGKMGHFLHSQAASEHKHEHSLIPATFQILKEDSYLFFFQMLWKSSGKLHDIRFLYGIDELYSFFFTEVMIKLTDTVEITVYCLRF